MFKPYFRQIGFKIGLAYCLLFSISSLAVFVGVYLLFSRSIEQKDKELIQSKLNEYSEVYRRSGSTGINDALVSQDSSRFLVRILDKNGKVLFFHMPKNWDASSRKQVEVKINSLALESSWNRIESGIEEDEDIEVLSQKKESLYVQVGYSTDERDDVLERIQKIFFLISVPILIFGTLGGIVFSRKTLAPIRNLVAVIHRVHAGDLRARATVTNTNDELDELSKTFNQMLDQIQDLIRNIRETTDNIAHDLRTPMTRFRAVAELALKRVESKEQLESALAECLEDAEEILTLVNTILDISVINTGVIRLESKQVFIGELFARVQDLYGIVAEDKEIKFSTDCPADLSLVADKVRLTQALANLVDNSIKYSPIGSQITLKALRSNGRVLISIKDNGPGIPAHDIPRIWERHYRGDLSRTERGLGLGLSLVLSIVQAHGAKVEVMSSNAGTIFEISFSNT